MFKIGKLYTPKADDRGRDETWEQHGYVWRYEMQSKRRDDREPEFEGGIFKSIATGVTEWMLFKRFEEIGEEE